jgi:hypothetical protein
MFPHVWVIVVADVYVTLIRPQSAMRLVFENPLQSLMGGIQGQIPGTVGFTLGQLRLVILVFNTLALVRMMYMWYQMI